MNLFTDFKDVEFTNVDTYHQTKSMIDTYFYKKLSSIINAIGYFIFACIALTSFPMSYGHPLSFIKNILFCVAFFGIASTYWSEFNARNSGDFFEKVSSVKEFELYNILIIIYGVLCLVVKDDRFHMFAFYRSSVERPKIGGIEIDGLLIIISHFLLGLSILAENYLTYIMLFCFSLYVFSYGLSFFFNLITESKSKNGTMFYAILLGSFFLVLGYILEFVLMVNEKILN